MKKSIKHCLKESGLNKKDHIMISFSGGPDSVALVKLLQEAGYKHIILIYFNHQLRSKKALKPELEFVKKFAKENELKLIIRKIPVKFCSKTFQGSYESAGHKLRQWLRYHHAKLNKCKAMFTGHHKDDWVETCYLKLLRGNVYSLPLKPKSYFEDILVCRPLLAFTKAELLDYLTEIGQGYCIDETNDSMDYTRNQIRHQLIPLANSIHHGSGNHLLDLFKRLDYMHNALIPNDYLEHCHLYEGQFFDYCDIHPNFFNLADYQRENILFRFLTKVYSIRYPINSLRKAFENKIDITREHILCINKAIDSNKIGSIGHFPRKLEIFHNKGRLYFYFPKRVPKDELLLTKQYQNFHGLKVKYEQLNKQPEDLNSDEQFCYISSSMANNLSIRFITKNDRYIPFSRKRAINVYDYLGKRQFPKLERKFLPCIVNNGEIVWMKGLPISNSAAIQSDDEHCIKISLQSLTGPLKHMVSY